MYAFSNVVLNEVVWEMRGHHDTDTTYYNKLLPYEPGKIILSVVTVYIGILLFYSQWIGPSTGIFLTVHLNTWVDI